MSTKKDFEKTTVNRRKNDKKEKENTCFHNEDTKKENDVRTHCAVTTSGQPLKLSA